MEESKKHFATKVTAFVNTPWSYHFNTFLCIITTYRLHPLSTVYEYASTNGKEVKQCQKHILEHKPINSHVSILIMGVGDDSHLIQNRKC